MSLPADQLNVHSLYNYFHNKAHNEFWLQEHLELNDCLYRSLRQHDFVATFDVDEVILPRSAYFTWHQLLDSLEVSKQ